jgi:ferredoxin-NADP reductase
MTNQPLADMRLTAIAYAAKDTNLYEFRRTDGANLPGIEPGAHIDIHLPNGMMRQYSLVTADGDPAAYVVGIKRDRASRGGSRYVHEYLGVAEILKIGGPRNHFPLIEDAPHSVLIAGGIGITPIWCMAQRLQKLGRSFELHYASRTRDEAAFLQELQKLPQAHVHIDAEAGGFLDLAPSISPQRKRPPMRAAMWWSCASQSLSLLFPKAAQSSKCCAMQASIRPIPASLACAARARRR